MRALWRFLLVLSVFEAAVHAQDDEDVDDEALDALLEEKVDQVDWKEDGKISLEELLGVVEDEKERALTKKLFKQADKDGDKLLDRDELLDMMKMSKHSNDEL
mmetsp:Transcript_1260/g.3671  ORF Transcript_1260/g.3671 Transcript_1260/m.3671 type:complete len:103 (+) Transcript_1260:86-394(+)